MQRSGRNYTCFSNPDMMMMWWRSQESISLWWKTGCTLHIVQVFQWFSGLEKLPWALGPWTPFKTNNLLAVGFWNVQSQNIFLNCLNNWMDQSCIWLCSRAIRLVWLSDHKQIKTKIFFKYFTNTYKKAYK